MARAYSQDLRDRVIEARESGTSARKAAARFEVAVSTAIKWLGRLRDSGERSARPQGRRSGSKLDPHRDFLLAAVEAEPDSTIAELQRRLVEERGVYASTGTIWAFLDRHDLTFKKKSAHAAEQNRPDVLAEREDWFEGQLDLDPEKLVFVDESFATTNMARRYGRAPRGQRLRAPIPHGHRRKTTLVAGLRLRGVSAADIMVPRADILAVEVETPVFEVLRFLVKEGHSRVPVYRGTLDDVIGISAVELGKAMGARVIAAASSEEKVALAKKHGADEGVVYPSGPFDKAGARALAERNRDHPGDDRDGGHENRSQPDVAGGD